MFSNHCIKKGVFLYLFLILTVVILTACGSSQNEILLKQVEQTTDNSLDDQVTTVVQQKESEKTDEVLLYVYVCGAVKHPDVYALVDGSRVNDAVKKAGGFLKTADRNGINLAERVMDGQQIYIPKEGESLKNDEVGLNHGTQQSDVIKQDGQGGDKVDLNTATKEQLMTLPGIGASKAGAILTYREEHGRFQTIEELKEIRGIKDGVFQNIKDLIIVR